MKVLNTKYESAGRVVLEDALKGIKVARNDRDYTKYDTAIFMSPDSEVRYAKSINPKIRCIIFDPKATTKKQKAENKIADLLIVSSIEQRDFFLTFNENVYIYYMFPDTPEVVKQHSNKDKLIIGYHGNKQHLSSMVEVSKALDEVAKELPIELWAIYNIKKLGKWKNTPKICPVKHIQWSKETQVDYLKLCDIGLVPSMIPSPKLLARPFKSLFYNRFIYNPEGYSKNDYVSRFKMSNNPGRIWVFSQLGIPVIADFTPSACQVIKDEHSGLLVGTKEGWVRAIKMLFDVELRNKLSYNLRRELKKSPNPFK
jgi:glycosyltransferase involved in cell wall biosynthesis